MISKFRFWSIAEQKMYEVLSIHVMTGMVEVEGGKYFLVPQDGSLMQSTGKFDKNGVEIFEGYVLKTSLFPFKTGRVIYDRFRYAFRVSCDGVSDPLYSFDWSNAEVIGSVYENPDLVEERE